MIRYAILTSGSCGNSYAFYDGNTVVLVDAGLTLTGLKRRLEEAAIPFDSISHVFITHMHPDHSKGLGVIRRRMNATLHASRPCMDSDESLFAKLGLKRSDVELFDFMTPVQAASFTFIPFRTSHDSAGSAGYFIKGGDACFFLMTDTGIYSAESLDFAHRSDVVFLESNYDDQLLECGHYPAFLKARIRGKRGHLSNSQARSFVSEIGPEGRKIFLVHVSDNNNTVEKVSSLYGGDENITVCERGRMYGGFDV